VKEDKYVKKTISVQIKQGITENHEKDLRKSSLANGNDLLQSTISTIILQKGKFKAKNLNSAQKILMNWRDFLRCVLV
jgi:hypothetical protein